MLSTKLPAANSIRNILGQVSETTVSVGAFTGHAVSTAQLAKLLDLVDEIESQQDGVALTPETSVADLGIEEDLSKLHIDRRKELADEIKQAQRHLNFSSKSDKPKLNVKLQALLSERARIDKALKSDRLSAKDES